jgi:adenylate cyclase
VSTEGLSHRLTAILAGDVAGFSRLMAQDERATIAALDEVRAVFRSEIEANRGRIVDMAGDSVLALFETATGALASALAVQERLEAAAAGVPEDRRMRVRIGMHLAEVTVKPDGTAYADGVNIAARLQSIAPPGGICVGHTLYDTVKAKLPLRAEFAGHQRFKNIPQPIAAWHVASPASTRPALVQRSRAAAIAASLAQAATAAWRRSQRVETPMAPPALDRKSIAVLPFTNLSDDPENAYFADGVQEELLCQLALLGDLKVISRTSVLEYRTRAKNLRQIGAQLGAGSLVEGSVRRAGNRVRVTVQLIDATSDKHLWGNTYDRELEDIFAIQSELAVEIARALDVRLRPIEQARLARKPPTRDFEAYELYLRQQDLHVRSLSHVSAAADALDERVALLERAVQRDPQFALAWARLAAEHARARFYSLDRTPERLGRVRQAIERALALAPDDVEVRLEAANVYYYGEGDFARAAQYFEELLRDTPHHVATLTQLALVRRRQGQWLDAHRLLEKAVAIDARFLPALGHLRENVLFFRHFDEALTLQARLVELQSGNPEAVCVRHEIEWLRTGSFASYDNWRSTLPAQAHRRSGRVWSMDFARAAARRDLEGMLLLLGEAPPAEAVGPTIFIDDMRAIVLAAKGERMRALELARDNLRAAAADLARQPDNVNFFYRTLLNHALLGERGVLVDYRRWSEKLRGDALAASELAELEPHMHALLGDRAAALASVSRQLREPMVSPEAWSRALLHLLLGDDATFVLLMGDPASRAPMPIVNREASVAATANGSSRI